MGASNSSSSKRIQVVQQGKQNKNRNFGRFSSGTTDKGKQKGNHLHHAISHVISWERFQKCTAMNKKLFSGRKIVRFPLAGKYWNL